MGKKKLTVQVFFSENNLSASIEELPYVIATGETFDELKKNVEEGVELFVEYCDPNDELAIILKQGYDFEYKIDLQSFLQIYSTQLPKSALQAITGINQKQLWHYASGVSKPSQRTIKKVSLSIHRFAEEIASMQFV